MSRLDTDLADLIAQAAMDQDQGLEQWSPKTSAIRDRIVRAFEEVQSGAERDRPEQQNVRDVQGREDPLDQVGSLVLPGVRRVAADPGAAHRPAVDEAAHRVYVAALGRAHSREAGGDLDHARDEWEKSLAAYVAAVLGH